jgi:hypothetical protein
MNFIFAVQVLLKAKFRDCIAGAVELFYRGLQLFRRVSSNNQFGLYHEVNIHKPKLYPEFAIMRGIIAYRRSQNSSPTKLTKLFAIAGLSF